MVITVVPGGLGIREGIVAAFAAPFGLSAATSVLAVATDRLVSTVVVLGAGIIYSYILGRSAGVGARVAATDGGQ
jgi:uncharacterized membrane protein YbhN (UPF0104 family)